MQNINVKRIYEDAESGDGARILVDRIWPRGISKEKARLTAWMKEIAPSTELRTWFHHTAEGMPDRFEAFKERYMVELSDAEHQEALQRLRDLAARETVTLLYAARNEQLNHATILKQYLENQEA
ncbi:DUF488 domain-containing protein [Paenibacillus thermotolerans]|uniref:DUF488 domain-containing protein n=1 Tax=Paenibacillus thermotolerans TaxID=3027807 RepID=UPI002368CAA5|nr:MULTISPECIES: DUF488 domain-containing protein [unclassified Paenibacillus]